MFNFKFFLLLIALGCCSAHGMPPKKNVPAVPVYSAATWTGQRDNQGVRRQSRLKRDPFFQQSSLPDFAIPNMESDSKHNPANSASVTVESPRSSLYTVRIFKKERKRAAANK